MLCIVLDVSKSLLQQISPFSRQFCTNSEVSFSEFRGVHAKSWRVSNEDVEYEIKYID